jgi:hypothetical protein
MTPQDTRSESLRDHTQRTGEDLQGVAGEAGARLRDEAQERAAAYASRQREVWSREVEVFANAIRAAGDQFERDEASGMARQTRSVAEGLDDVAHEIRDRAPGEAFRSIESFARRQPAAFVGASVMAGFFLSRFLKSSSAEAGYDEPHGEHEPVTPTPAEATPAPAAAPAAMTRAAATTPGSPAPVEPAGSTGPVSPTSSVGPVPGEGRPATEPPRNPADPSKPEPGRTI